MSILDRLDAVEHNLKVLKASGHNMTFELTTISATKELISRLHKLVDGKEWNSQTTCDMADLLATQGLEVRPVDEEEE